MATSHDDPATLRDTIAYALAIADEQENYLVAALLAECLDQLDRTLSQVV